MTWHFRSVSGGRHALGSARRRFRRSHNYRALYGRDWQLSTTFNRNLLFSQPLAHSLYRDTLNKRTSSFVVCRRCCASVMATVRFLRRSTQRSLKRCARTPVATTKTGRSSRIGSKKIRTHFRLFTSCKESARSFLDIFHLYVTIFCLKSCFYDANSFFAFRFKFPRVPLKAHRGNVRLARFVTAGGW